MFEFASAWVLFFLLLLPLFYMLERFWRKRPSVVVSQTAPFAAAGRKRFNPTFPEWCRLLAAALLIVALARPRTGDEKVIVRAQGIDIVLALDMSGSMRAYDVPQNITDGRKLLAAIERKEIRNRIDVAKEEIRRFIEQRPNDRIGLIAFAPMPYVACPPTLDHPWLLAHLQNLTLGMVGDGTGIAGPIASGVKRLENTDSKRKVLVLFTDGRNNIQSRLTPLQAAETADTLGVTVYTVGIGSGNAAIVQKGFFGNTLQMVQGEFDEELLKALAEKTKGAYYHASDRMSMHNAMKEIDRLEKTSAEQQIHINWAEYYPLLSLLALLAVFTGFLLENSFCRRLV